MLDKYKVYKVSDGARLDPGTFFVIRPGDVFSQAGMWAYVHAVRTVAETMKAMGANGDDLARIETFADDVFDIASTWAEQRADGIVGAKVPD